ncbi:hypothetical protein ABIB35_002798 [Arthrobacter sp. UYP6]|uniref:hypothetical protein n=1 Tax=Arthrobacter sp. UYP6 TaxID=1756378 RepID=UPI00339B2FAB
MRSVGVLCAGLPRCGQALPRSNQHADDHRIRLRTGFYFYTGYGQDYPYLFFNEEPKLSGKSPQGSNEKKPGKSIKDKRAEKRAKSASDSELIPKKRKGQ